MIKYIWEVIFIYSNELVCNILKYINININTEITIINLSNIFSYDKTYIMKKFKRELGLTIIEYINNKRILNSLNGYKSNTTITILQNISSNVDKVRVNATGRIAYINNSNYTNVSVAKTQSTTRKIKACTLYNDNVV